MALILREVSVHEEFKPHATIHMLELAKHCEQIVATGVLREDNFTLSNSDFHAAMQMTARLNLDAEMPTLKQLLKQHLSATSSGRQVTGHLSDETFTLILGSLGCAHMTFTTHNKNDNYMFLEVLLSKYVFVFLLAANGADSLILAKGQIDQRLPGLAPNQLVHTTSDYSTNYSTIIFNYCYCRVI